MNFSWTKDCDESFKKIKCVLMNTPVLSAPYFDKQFKLTVDASDKGIGVALFHECDDGVDRVVCYFSKKLSKSQKNYSTIGKECLALLLALQHFDVYLNVTLHPILVYTDHNPLTFLCKMSNKNQRLLQDGVCCCKNMTLLFTISRARIMSLQMPFLECHDRLFCCYCTI